MQVILGPTNQYNTRYWRKPERIMSQEEIRQSAAQLQEEQTADPEKWTPEQEAALQMLVAQDLIIQIMARKQAA